MVKMLCYFFKGNSIFIPDLVCSDYIFTARIKISIFSLGKGRILVASACPREEGGAREGKDTCTWVSSLIRYTKVFYSKTACLLILYSSPLMI